MATTQRGRRSSKDRAASRPGEGVADYRSELWKMADALRGSMDAAEYKHVVLGLIFLKYISDAFEEAHARLEAERDQGADPEHPDEYRAQNIFWVPPEARWQYLKSQTRQPTIGRLVDDAMTAIERDNRALRDVLPKDYARPGLDKTRLGRSSTWLATSRWAGPRHAPRTCWATSTSTSWSSSHWPRVVRGASSTPRARSCGFWWRCWSHTRGACTTPAAALRACSSSRWSSSRPTPAATGTAAGPVATSPSTGRSRTTRHGAWPG